MLSARQIDEGVDERRDGKGGHGEIRETLRIERNSRCLSRIGRYSL